METATRRRNKEIKPLGQDRETTKGKQRHRNTVRTRKQRQGDRDKEKYTRRQRQGNRDKKTESRRQRQGGRDKETETRRQIQEDRDKETE